MRQVVLTVNSIFTGTLSQNILTYGLCQNRQNIMVRVHYHSFCLSEKMKIIWIFVPTILCFRITDFIAIANRFYSIETIVPGSMNFDQDKYVKYSFSCIVYACGINIDPFAGRHIPMIHTHD